jgi:hypothetical protein
MVIPSYPEKFCDEFKMAGTIGDCHCSWKICQNTTNSSELGKKTE